jgi:hypothetical protein
MAGFTVLQVDINYMTNLLFADSLPTFKFTAAIFTLLMLRVQEV